MDEHGGWKSPVGFEAFSRWCFFYPRKVHFPFLVRDSVGCKAIVVTR